MKSLLRFLPQSPRERNATLVYVTSGVREDHIAVHQSSVFKISRRHSAYSRTCRKVIYTVYPWQEIVNWTKYIVFRGHYISNAPKVCQSVVAATFSLKNYFFRHKIPSREFLSILHSLIKSGFHLAKLQMPNKLKQSHYACKKVKFREKKWSKEHLIIIHLHIQRLRGKPEF